MNDLISIIIPIYNAEEYIEECIDSIIQQSYKNWELILVNDGSTDNSFTICKKYSLNYQNINTYNKTNEGVSIARNYGISKAKGKWITFIDSDDYISKDYLNQLCENLECDMIIGGYRIFGYENKTIKPTDYHSFSIVPNNFIYIDVYENNPNINILYHICGKLYKIDIINKNNIYFNKEMKLGEDTCFNIEYISYCNNLCIIPYAGYFYRKNDYQIKRTMDYCTYSKHLSLFSKSVDNLLIRKGYLLTHIYNSINKAFFESLNEHLYISSNHKEFIETSKLLNVNELRYKEIFSRSYVKGIIMQMCYNYPHFGFYFIKLIYNIKRNILKKLI